MYRRALSKRVTSADFNLWTVTGYCVGTEDWLGGCYAGPVRTDSGLPQDGLPQDGDSGGGTSKWIWGVSDVVRKAQGHLVSERPHGGGGGLGARGASWKLGESYCSYGLHTAPLFRAHSFGPWAPGPSRCSLGHPLIGFLFSKLWLASSTVVSFWVLFLLLGIFPVLLVEFQEGM